MSLNKAACWFNKIITLTFVVIEVNTPFCPKNEIFYKNHLIAKSVSETVFFKLENMSYLG